MTARPPPLPRPNLPKVEPIEYASTTRGAGARALGTAIWAVIWLVFTGLVVHIGFGVITPAMERVFQDFKLDLPGVTMAWIGLSRAFIGGGWMAWWALVLGGATLLIIFRPPEKAEGRSAGWIVLLLALRYGWVFIAAVGVVSMALPYLSLVESVTSPKP